MPTPQERSLLEQIRTSVEAAQKARQDLIRGIETETDIYPLSTGITDPGQELEKQLNAIQTHLAALLSGDSGSEDTSVEEYRSPEQKPSIRHFFEEVADGVVKAQESLDEQSRDYMTSLSPLALPSIFRLPKITAEFQFGIQSSKTSGFDVFIASRESTEQEKMQQKISFEIISAPPPPDYVANLKSTPLRFPYIGSPLERLTVMQYIRTLSGQEGLADPKKALASELGRAPVWRTVLIFRGTASWFLIFPRKADDQTVVRVESLVLDGSDFSTGGNISPKSLAEFFLRLSEQQETAIKERERLENETRRIRGS